MAEMAYETARATRVEQEVPCPPLREVLRDHIELLSKEIIVLEETLAPILGVLETLEPEPSADKAHSPHSSEMSSNLDALLMTILALRAVRDRIEL